MNVAIAIKTLRESALLLLMTVAGVILLEALFVGVISSFATEFEYMWLNNALIQNMARLLGGADFPVDMTPSGMMTIGFAHPVLFALVWAFVLVTCSRVIVGEIEHGTADLLLTLPVSRSTIYMSTSLVWVLCGLPISCATLLGAKVGTMCFDLDQPLEFAKLALVVPNLLSMFVCVGCMTMCCASFVLSRGTAVAIVVACLLGSFLLNFLAQLWPAAERISVIGMMHYYRPMAIMRSGEWPIGDISVLLGAGAVFWVIGLLRYTSKDVKAV